MSKVITLSRTFPKGHPREGEETYFLEKAWNSFRDENSTLPDSFDLHVSACCHLFVHGIYEPKHHTIRSGKRFKTGDKVSLRVWSGRPYHSKQIAIAPEVEVRVWDIYVEPYLDKVFIDGHEHLSEFFNQIAKNDGLSAGALYHWICPGRGQSFQGQIICWNPAITY